ncbi:Meiotically Up-regulated Gene 113 (MUG113) protein [Sphingomonas sp. PP-CE-3G-477]|uniref:GIY-YIG nuclease family protein n=1 Tax=Sphingomonas sp. PP-CE-3G-477 TaxID=2135660 RepID=UPI000D34D141|nr:GIY-YIG nuclease family protein [Sphingomonas sp. PP-CE-3G-477]PTQ64500.1 Meiotically Up-regulated Gene 113 (MUG113) protein [Sphingomonas sp. PP-CE-3G-477]
MTGVVYFIGNLEHKIVKIGFTAGSVLGRLKGIQTGSPVRLSILAYIEGTREDEARLHRTFSPIGLFGEWFSIEGKLDSFLCYLTGYAEESGLLVSDEQFAAAIHDNVINDHPPHPSINADLYATSADASEWGHLA